MSLSNLSKKQLKERIRFLSDKIQSIYDDIEPKIMEFSELKKEYLEILLELKNRGVISDDNIKNKP